MDRILFLTFRNHQVLLADCSDCTPEELAAVIDNVPKYVTKEPLGSVLLLADFSHSSFTKETVEHLKLAAVFDRPHLKRSAWVGIESLPKVFYQHIKTFSQRDLPAFKTREEAMDWLVSDKEMQLPDGTLGDLPKRRRG